MMQKVQYLLDEKYISEDDDVVISGGNLCGVVSSVVMPKVILKNDTEFLHIHLGFTSLELKS